MLTHLRCVWITERPSKTIPLKIILKDTSSIKGRLSNCQQPFNKTRFCNVTCIACHTFHCCFTHKFNEKYFVHILITSHLLLERDHLFFSNHFCSHLETLFQSFVFFVFHVSFPAGNLYPSCLLLLCSVSSSLLHFFSLAWDLPWLCSSQRTECSPHRLPCKPDHQKYFPQHSSLQIQYI